MKVCMLAYAYHSVDARIKSYRKTLECQRIDADLITLKEKAKKKKEFTKSGVIYYLTKKYRGNHSWKYIYSYLKFFGVSMIKLSILYIKNGYKSIHVHNMPNFLVFAAVLPKMAGATIILDNHDIMTIVYMTKFFLDENHWLCRLLKIEQRISAAFADHVICADHLQKKKLIEYGIAKEKITVIMNLPNDKNFQNIAANNDNHDKFKLIYHGTIAERTGIDILLKAINRINKEIPIYLYIYGQGDFLNEALALSNRLNLKECVYFSQGFFPVEKVPYYISKMDLGIVPYKKTPQTDQYGMSVKLLEYVYFKIPVVAPDLKIIKYYFSENMIKFFEAENADDLARCITELYKNPDERKALVENSHKFYEKYSWREQEQIYLDLIRKPQSICQ